MRAQKGPFQFSQAEAGPYSSPRTAKAAARGRTLACCGEPRRSRRRSRSGFTLIELLFAISLLSILAAVAVAQITTGIDRSRATAAARYLAQQCALARFQAVGGSANVALRFDERNGDYDIQMFVDGNGNGVRTTDIAGRVDPPLTTPVTLGANFPGVRIGLSPRLRIADKPVKIGNSPLLSFTPLGTATSGSIYVVGRDGTQLVVRVLGATARTRVLRYEPDNDTWVQP